MGALRALVLAAIAAVLSTATATAHGGDRERRDETEARERYAAGLRAFEVGAYGEARAELEASYALAPYPGTLLLVAQCEERLGRTEATIARYEQFLGVATNAARRAEVAAKVASLRELLATSCAVADEAERAELLPLTAATLEAPPPVAEPARTSAAPTPMTDTRPQPHRRRWVWGVVAGAVFVAAGVAIGLGVGLGRGPRDSSTRIMDVAF
jgi:tetratricopeptide (TPR) repeat protein